MKRAAFQGVVFHSLSLLAACVLAGPVAAQSIDQSRIGDSVGQDASGRLSINQAAGVGNAQVNLMAVARGKLASAQAHASQLASNPESARAASSDIQSGAFGGFQGALALNQTAGANNLQSNLLVIETSGAIATTDDATLAQTVAMVAAPTEGAGSAPEVTREARIDANAFRGASGVLQVNQSAGVGNSATNAVVVRLPATAGGI